MAAETASPFSNHWYCSGAEPAAITVKLVLSPVKAKVSAGGVMIEGEVCAELCAGTVRIAMITMTTKCSMSVKPSRGRMRLPPNSNPKNGS